MISGKSRKLTNYEPMTKYMETVLLELRASEEQGFPFAALEGVGIVTIRALIRRDWIVASTGHDGVRYRLTGRGEKALKAYQQKPYRFDGICPRCGINPRTLTKGGNLTPYCPECTRTQTKKQYALKGRQLRADSPCSRCRVKPRYICSTGRIKIYCAECLKESRAEERRRKHARLLGRIADGEILLCSRCKEKPRHHSTKIVYDYCRDCYRQQQSTYHRRAKLTRRMQELF